MSFKYHLDIGLICTGLILALVTATGTTCAQTGVSSGSYGIAKSGWHRTGNDGQYLMPEPNCFALKNSSITTATTFHCRSRVAELDWTCKK